MSFFVKVKYITAQKNEYLKVPLGKVRMDYELCKNLSLKRNDFIKIVPENKNGKAIIRQIFMSANLGKNTCVLDYDSVNLLGGTNDENQLEIKKIKKISFLPSIKYFLTSDPDLGTRRAYQLAVISLVIGIISLVISLIN